MDREKRNRLRRGSMEVMEKLDLPGNLSPQVPRLELIGNREFYMDRHRGVISYTTDTVDIAAGGLVVRLFGKDFEIVAMTDEELRITGIIDRMELLE